MKSKEVFALIFALYSTWFSIGIYALFLQLYAFYVIGVSNLLVGLLATIYFGVNAPTSIIGGYLIDKYGEAKILLLFSLGILAVSNFITPLYGNGYYLLFIRSLQGISTAIIVPLSNLLGARLMGTGKGIGVVNMFGSLGFASAGLLGGFLADYLSYIPLFYIGGIVVFIAFINMMLIPRKSYNLVGSQKIEFKYISRIASSIWIIYIAYSLRIIAAGGIWSLFSLFLFSIGGTNFLVGLANSLNTVTQVILFKKIGEYSEGRGLKSFKIGLISSIIVFIAYYLSGNIYQILPFQVLLAFSWVFLYAGANVYIIENTPSEIQGTALGLLSMFNALSWIIGSSLNGYISDIYGNYKIYILIGVFIAFIGYLLVEFYQHIKRKN